MENGFVQNAASGPLQQDNQIPLEPQPLELEGATTCRVYRSIGDSPWEKPKWLPMPICCSCTVLSVKLLGIEQALTLRTSGKLHGRLSPVSGCHCQKDGHYWKLELGTSGIPKSRRQFKV
jgi:hypothetical protein